MKRARLQLQHFPLPPHLVGKVAPLALGVAKNAPVVGEVEMDRIGIQSGRASKLVAEAPPALVALLVRLVQAAPESGLVFDSAAVLERFFADTAAMGPATAAALSDTELAELWQRVERG
jgi:hypothetical protein